MNTINIQRHDSINGLVSAEDAAKLKVDRAFTVSLFAMCEEYSKAKNCYIYKLSDELESGNHYIETTADLNHVDQKIIDAIGVAVADIHDYSENELEEEPEYRYHFDKTNKMIINLDNGLAFNSDMTEACGWS